MALTALDPGIFKAAEAFFNMVTEAIPSDELRMERFKANFKVIEQRNLNKIQRLKGVNMGRKMRQLKKIEKFCKAENIDVDDFLTHLNKLNSL
jgi:hypothetical protein